MSVLCDKIYNKYLNNKDLNTDYTDLTDYHGFCLFIRDYG